MWKHYMGLSFPCHKRPFSSGFPTVVSSSPIVHGYHRGREAKFPLGDNSQTSPGFVLLVRVCWPFTAALGQYGVEVERHERLNIAVS